LTRNPLVPHYILRLYVQKDSLNVEDETSSCSSLDRMQLQTLHATSSEDVNFIQPTVRGIYTKIIHRIHKSLRHAQMS
jgi:hypothetical protein